MAGGSSDGSVAPTDQILESGTISGTQYPRGRVMSAEELQGIVGDPKKTVTQYGPIDIVSADGQPRGKWLNATKTEQPKPGYIPKENGEKFSETIEKTLPKPQAEPTKVVEPDKASVAMLRKELEKEAQNKAYDDDMPAGFSNTAVGRSEYVDVMVASNRARRNNAYTYDEWIGIGLKPEAAKQIMLNTTIEDQIKKTNELRNANR
jgi:hypothetical protein